VLGAGAAGRLRKRLPSLAAWAANRSITPASLTGISLLLGSCGAGWLSGRAAHDLLWGVLALCLWFLCQAAASRLDSFMGQKAATARPVAAAAAWSARGLAGSTDWLVLPDLAWDDEPVVARISGGGSASTLVASARTGSGSLSGDRPSGPQQRFGWLSAICAIAVECAVYGGIAVRGQSAGQQGIWPLAVLAIVLVAIAEMTVACCGAGSAGQRRTPASAAAGEHRSLLAFWQWTDLIVAPPAAARLLIALIALLTGGPEIALITVAAAEAASILAVLAIVIFAPGRSLRFTSTVATPSSGDTASLPGPALVLACRDDGPVARWAGRLVQGNLIPLPPAFAGVAATCVLAALGLRNLPGIICLTPPVVMMLASGGSSHRHDGKLDWLTPVLLAVGQFVYLAALGFELRVPGPAVFAACAVTSVWYASIATQPAPRLSAGIGWEGRTFAIGLTAIFGLATFGYLGLAAYLGALICWTVVNGYQVPKEEAAGDRYGSRGRSRPATSTRY
jgi:hypothetical protein